MWSWVFSFTFLGAFLAHHYLLYFGDILLIINEIDIIIKDK
jgi:hypothetical protein